MFRKNMLVLSEVKNTLVPSHGVSGMLTLRTGNRLTQVSLSLYAPKTLSYYIMLRSGGEYTTCKAGSGTTVFSVPAVGENDSPECFVIAHDGKNPAIVAYAGESTVLSEDKQQAVMRRLPEALGIKPYYRTIASRLSRLLEENPAYKPLIKAVKNSYWVRIDKEKGFYAIGVVTQENTPKYIAYALPEEYSAAPQSDFSFVEVTENNAPKGFFVIYQDAFTGKLVSP